MSTPRMLLPSTSMPSRSTVMRERNLDVTFTSSLASRMWRPSVSLIVMTASFIASPYERRPSERERKEGDAEDAGRDPSSFSPGKTQRRAEHESAGCCPSWQRRHVAHERVGERDRSEHRAHAKTGAQPPQAPAHPLLPEAEPEPPSDAHATHTDEEMERIVEHEKEKRAVRAAAQDPGDAKSGGHGPHGGPHQGVAEGGERGPERGLRALDGLGRHVGAAGAIGLEARHRSQGVGGERGIGIEVADVAGQPRRLSLLTQEARQNRAQREGEARPLLALGIPHGLQEKAPRHDARQIPGP